MFQKHSQSRLRKRRVNNGNQALYGEKRDSQAPISESVEDAVEWEPWDSKKDSAIIPFQQDEIDLSIREVYKKTKLQDKCSLCKTSLISARSGHEKCLLSNLLKEDKDNFTKDSKNKSMLLAACENGHFDCVLEIIAFLHNESLDIKELLDHRDTRGYDCLAYAIANEDLRTMDLLLEEGCTLVPKSSDILSCVHVAIAIGNEKAIELLCLYAEDSDYECFTHIFHGQSPLMFGILNDVCNCVGLLCLFLRQSDINFKQEKSGRNALMLMLETNSLTADLPKTCAACMASLLKNGADPFNRDKDEQDCFSRAIHLGDSIFLRDLFGYVYSAEYFPDLDVTFINNCSYDGKSLLMIAAEESQADCLRVLLYYGAKKSTTDDSGKIAWDYARLNNDPSGKECQFTLQPYSILTSETSFLSVVQILLYGTLASIIVRGLVIYMSNNM